MINYYKGHKIYMNGQYPAIFLNGKNIHLHRYVWREHCGEIPEGYIIHHKDEDKTNYSIENLELISRAEHVLKHQQNLHNECTTRFGEESRHHILSKEEVDYIKRVYVKYDKNFGGRALAKQFGVSEVCISKIVNGVSWGGKKVAQFL